MNRGFTLIELMIVVAIIAIIAAFAYPSYTKYVAGTHQTQVKTDILAATNAMETHFARHLTYDPTNTGDDPISAHTKSPADGDQMYKIEIQHTDNGTAYNIKATPTGAPVANTGIFTYFSSGKKTWANGDSNTDNWDKD